MGQNWRIPYQISTQRRDAPSVLTEISVRHTAEISVRHTTEISVKLTSKTDDSSFNRKKLKNSLFRNVAKTYGIAAEPNSILIL